VGPPSPAGPGREAAWDVEYYRPVPDGLWQAFGVDRLVFGNDWPMPAAPLTAFIGSVHDSFAGQGERAAA
jgi:predicted TIM-barrel fold metal-dependent hydrolase